MFRPGPGAGKMTAANLMHIVSRVTMEFSGLVSNRLGPGEVFQSSHSYIDLSSALVHFLYKNKHNPLDTSKMMADKRATNSKIEPGKNQACQGAGIGKGMSRYPFLGLIACNSGKARSPNLV